MLCRRACGVIERRRRPELEVRQSIQACLSQQRYRTGSAVGDGRPLRVAIVGSGPAGFYTARKLMMDVPHVSIDMYEQLPVPFGLVRFGVAPDHPEVKNCQDTFTEVAQDRRFTYIGNVHLGRELPLALLTRHHHAVIFAYGASKDRTLGLEGEGDTKNIYSARAFVGWYNGLPEYRDLKPDLTAGEDAVVIGQGNVALDVARILLTDIDVLRKTDITTWALERLAENRIKTIRIVGRRGPMQAAFTIKEVRELMQLPDTHFHPLPADLFPPDLSSLARPHKRIMQLLQKGSSCGPGAKKSWSLDFLLAPQSISSSSAPSHISHTASIKALTGITFTRTKLTEPFSPTSPLFPTREDSPKMHIPTSTLFRSIGYTSEPLPGFDKLGISFDKRKGTIDHDGLGRILSAHHVTDNSQPLPGLYCAGWVKRGPTGVIASTMNDAFATADSITSDRAEGRSFLQASGAGWRGVAVDAQKLGIHVEPVDWRQWEIIDSVEKARGAQQGRIRDKIGRVSEMLALA